VAGAAADVRTSDEDPVDAATNATRSADIGMAQVDVCDPTPHGDATRCPAHQLHGRRDVVVDLAAKTEPAPSASRAIVCASLARANPPSLRTQLRSPKFAMTSSWSAARIVRSVHALPGRQTGSDFGGAIRMDTRAWEPDGAGLTLPPIPYAVTGGHHCHRCRRVGRARLRNQRCGWRPPRCALIKSLSGLGACCRRGPGKSS
jgi:hypothetical protein